MRMPLNPNGKIDKPALPFPDTAQASNVAASTKATNPTEQKMQSIWAGILPNPPSPIPLDESFFDLGGHSILATRLIFEIRKVFVVSAPMGLIFEQPTIAGLVAAVDALRNADLGLDYQPTPTVPVGGAVTTAGQVLGVPGAEAPKETTAAPFEYGQDYIKLLEKLKPSYPSLPSDFYDRPVKVFLTGATGFLGAFVLKDLLLREQRVKKVICLVRGSDQEKALARLREGSTDRGVWDEKWVQEGRLEVVTGDLGLETFGLNQATWDRVAAEADVVLHNGALVCLSSCWHQYLYSTLYALGPLGVPLRAFEGAQCARDPHCGRFGFVRQTQGIGVRQLDISHRH
jgi:L-aminoadipate-semialdehyde dehydrogenase